MKIGTKIAMRSKNRHELKSSFEIDLIFSDFQVCVRCRCGFTNNNAKTRRIQFTEMCQSNVLEM